MPDARGAGVEAGTPATEETVDVLIAGSGAAGLTAAVTAGRAGLKVLIVEKESLFGGTTSFSGGVIWIPGARHSVELSKSSGKPDSTELGRNYIYDIAGEGADPGKIEAFLNHGPKMVDFMEANSEVRFYSMYYPDYISESPSSGTFRSMGTQNYETGRVGPHLKNLRNLLPQTLFLGMAIGSTVEIKEFLNATRSLKSFWYVAKKMMAHARDMLVYGRSEQVVRGRALVARLARTAFDLGIPLWLSSPVAGLISENGRVVGAWVDRNGTRVRVNATRGVVLACGGFARDPQRRAAAYPPLVNYADHPTPVPAGNTGDGVRMAEAVGAQFADNTSQPAPWMPVSRKPGVGGVEGVWPHFVDRQKPGFIAVARSGRRFADESGSYHYFVPEMVRSSREEGESEAIAWLVADTRAVNRYGMGFARPFPIPRGHHVKSGYLLRGNTVEELARVTGIDPEGLRRTIAQFNEYARQGIDADFGRGSRTYDKSQGDDEVKPNPCLAPLEVGPFYAVRMYASEIGSFAGLKTDAFARALDRDGQPIGGLYAVGNDQASVFGGAYPGAGATLGPAMTFGYIAGRHLAGELG